MRRDIEEYLKFYLKEDCVLLNKSEIARRFDCDPRTVERYLKLQNIKCQDPMYKKCYIKMYN